VGGVTEKAKEKHAKNFDSRNRGGSQKRSCDRRKGKETEASQMGSKLEENKHDPSVLSIAEKGVATTWGFWNDESIGWGKRNGYEVQGQKTIH